MCEAEVTAISLVTGTTRDAVCHSLIPNVARALSNQCVTHERLPLTQDYIDWVINDTDQLTVALDDVDDKCVILVATRGTSAELAAARLANVAADLCRDYDVHTLFWNGSEQPIDAREFLFGETEQAAEEPLPVAARIMPRRVRAAARRVTQKRPSGLTQFDHSPLDAVRVELTTVNHAEIEQMEFEERRAKTAPMRLSAWAMSIATALIATPLALPLIAHNLLRGEDIRSGAMALGVAGLYTSMAHTEMLTGLVTFL